MIELRHKFTLYFQAIEFVQFKERLQHSSQYLVAQVEAPILQLKQNADNIEEEEVIHVFATLVELVPLLINATVGFLKCEFTSLSCLMRLS